MGKLSITMRMQMADIRARQLRNDPLQTPIDFKDRTFDALVRRDYIESRPDRALPRARVRWYLTGIGEVVLMEAEAARHA